jgi:hypothetical protein
MEDSDMTNWAAVGSPTTREKATTASGDLPFGRQCVHIAGGDQEGATSNNAAVDDSEMLYVGVPINLVSGSADIILYDSTNSAALRTINVTNQQQSIVWFQEPPGSSTKNITIRLLGSEASSEFYAGPVFVWSGMRDRYTVDTSSFERGRDLKGTFRMRLGHVIESDVYVMLGLDEIDFMVERDDRGNLINIVIPSTSWPVLVKGDRRYVELANDTDTTFAERDMVVQGAMWHIARARAARMMADNPALAGFHNSRAREYARTYSRMLESAGITLVDVEDSSSDRQMVRFR